MKKKIIKGTVQIIAGLIGLFGLFGIITFASFLIKSVVQKEDLALPLFNGVTLILSGYFVYTGYQVLRNYSLKSIQHFCQSFFFLFLGLLSNIIQPWSDEITENTNTALLVFCFLCVLILAYLLVKILHKCIAKYTLDDSEENIPQTEM